MSELKSRVTIACSRGVVDAAEPYTLTDLQTGSKGWRNYRLKRHKDSRVVDKLRTEWRLGWNGQRLARTSDHKALLDWEAEEDERLLYAWVVSSLMLHDIGMQLLERATSQ